MREIGLFPFPETAFTSASHAPMKELIIGSG
jgi:hypothetical protein